MASRSLGETFRVLPGRPRCCVPAAHPRPHPGCGQGSVTVAPPGSSLMGTQPFSLMTECVALGCQRIARAAFFFLRDSDGGGTKGPLGLLSLARPEGVEAPQSFLSSYVALFLLHRVSCLGGGRWGGSTARNHPPPGTRRTRPSAPGQSQQPQWLLQPQGVSRTVRALPSSSVKTPGPPPQRPPSCLPLEWDWRAWASRPRGA